MKERKETDIFSNSKLKNVNHSDTDPKRKNELS
jgi:hypothetical protein